MDPGGLAIGTVRQEPGTPSRARLFALLALLLVLILGTLAVLDDDELPRRDPLVVPGSDAQGNAAPTLATTGDAGRGATEHGTPFHGGMVVAAQAGGAPPTARNAVDAVAPTARESNAAGVAARVQVHLDFPPEWLKGEGHVYALPAGAPGATDSDLLPRRRVQAVTAVDLPLPAPGRWDIGFVCPFGHVLVTDVEIPATRAFRISAPDAAPIRFRLGGGLARDVRADAPVAVRVRNVEEEPCAYPGRKDVPRVQVKVPLDANGEGVTPPLAAGIAFRFRFSLAPDSRAYGLSDGKPTYRWHAMPGVAHAGAGVEIAPVSVGVLRFRLSLTEPIPRPWSERLEGLLWTAIEAQCLDREEEPRFASTWLAKDGTLRVQEIRLAVMPGRHALKIGVGKCWHTRERVVTVRAGETLPVDAALSPDASFVPGQGQPADPDGLATDIKLNISGASTGVWSMIGTIRRDDGDNHHDQDGELPREKSAEVTSTELLTHIQVVRYPDRASGLLPAPTRGELDVVLRPAGMLVVVPEITPDPALGVPLIQRPDGHPIPFLAEAPKSPADSKVEVEAAQRIPIRVGLILGPFPAGRLTLQVILGGTLVETLEAEVRAGRFTALPIRFEGRTRSR